MQEKLPALPITTTPKQPKHRHRCQMSHSGGRDVKMGWIQSLPPPCCPWIGQTPNSLELGAAVVGVYEKWKPPAAAVLHSAHLLFHSPGSPWWVVPAANWPCCVILRWLRGNELAKETWWRAGYAKLAAPSCPILVQKKVCILVTKIILPLGNFSVCSGGL